MTYHKMDTLRACITSISIHLYIPGQTPKNAKIVGQEQLVDIMKNQPVITREEFESNIPTNTAEYTFFKTMYLLEVQNES